MNLIKIRLPVNMKISAHMDTAGANRAGLILAKGLAYSVSICATAATIVMIVPLFK